MGKISKVFSQIAEGDTLLLPLEDKKAVSWRVRASLINRQDGYRHYSVSTNQAAGVLAIVNNGDKYKQI